MKREEKLCLEGKLTSRPSQFRLGLVRIMVPLSFVSLQRLFVC